MYWSVTQGDVVEGAHGGIPGRVLDLVRGEFACETWVSEIIGGHSTRR